MTNLIKTEWLKIKGYNAFWWIMGLTALSYPGINYIFYQIYHDLTGRKNATGELSKLVLGNPFSFPENWHTVAYASSIFVFIPAVVVIMFISNEYTFRTHRQNIIDGWSRRQFITSKLIDVVIVSLLVTALCFLAALIAGFANNGDKSANYWKGIQYIGLFGLQTFAQLSIAFLIGFLVRKAFMALGIFIFYYLILENIMVGWSRFKLNDAGRFLPLEMSDRMIPPPTFMSKFGTPEQYQAALDNIPLYLGLSMAFTSVIWLICYYVNSRRDLK